MEQLQQYAERAASRWSSARSVRSDAAAGAGGCLRTTALPYCSSLECRRGRGGSIHCNCSVHSDPLRPRRRDEPRTTGQFKMIDGNNNIQFLSIAILLIIHCTLIARNLVNKLFFAKLIAQNIKTRKQCLITFLHTKILT